MTATHPLFADPDSVTHWSCPEAPAESQSHHMRTVHNAAGIYQQCAYCHIPEGALRTEQAAILALKAKITDPPAGSTVNVHQSILIPDGDIETLIEMAGYGIKYWAGEAQWDRVGRTYKVELDDEARTDDSLPPERTLEYNWLAKRLVQLGLGIGDLEGVSPRSDVAGYAREYMATVLAGEPDAGIIDADLADVIVQLAYFNGKVMFG